MAVGDVASASFRFGTCVQLPPAGGETLLPVWRMPIVASMRSPACSAAGAARVSVETGLAPVLATALSRKAIAARAGAAGAAMTAPAHAATITRAFTPA